MPTDSTESDEQTESHTWRHPSRRTTLRGLGTAGLAALLGTTVEGEERTIEPSVACSD